MSPVTVIAQKAQLGLLYEVTCLNKPGLVDPVDNGSHTDMDVFTFLESSVVLLPYFEQFVEAGITHRNSPIEKTFVEIRRIGLEAEKAMFMATNMINTHKGAIFSLGIFQSICGRLEIWEEFTTITNFQKTIQSMTKNLFNDFRKINDKPVNQLTWGEKLYSEFGISGIRGEAYQGYPAIFQYGLPYYQSHQGSQQNKLIDTLLKLTLKIEDTTLIKRSANVEISAVTSKLVKNYFEKGSSYSSEGRAYLIELNDLFKKKKWSLGGSADALILVVFLDNLSQMGWLKNKEV